MKDFANKVAVVTGAGSGIGRALAVRLAGRGARLALADISPTGLQRTVEQLHRLGAASSIHVVDVADRDALAVFAVDVAREHGAVHLVINNAGVTVVDRVELMSIEDFEWVMNINFWGVVNGTRAFLPYLYEADEAHIVNVSSLFGLMSMPLQSAYNASKFAVRGFTEALKMELAGTHIGVSCVHPGGIKTGIVKHSRMREESLDVSRDEIVSRFDRGALTTPDKAAGKILRGIEKNKRRILIGPDARLLDLLVRLFPGSYEKILRLEAEVRRKAAERAEQAQRA